MPIRINLLAEAQAAEELRRRDPVKRAAWIGLLLVACVLSWASLLQARITLRKAQVNRLESKIDKLKPDYGEIVKTQKTLNEAELKLTALDRLSENRYLSGNLMNALQRAYVPDVRIVKLKTHFDYTLKGATKAKTNDFKITAGTPATSAEQITVSIEAVDSCSAPGDQVNEYKQAVASLDHIQSAFSDQACEVRLTSLNPPQIDASGRSFVLFTLECAYPEIVR